MYNGFVTLQVGSAESPILEEALYFGEHDRRIRQERGVH